VLLGEGGHEVLVARGAMWEVGGGQLGLLGGQVADGEHPAGHDQVGEATGEVPVSAHEHVRGRGPTIRLA
jgi:hypothetical protein